MKSSLRCIIVALTLGLAGCQTYKEYLMEQGYPPAFADGFSDGCVTGKQSINGIGAFHKDLDRFGVDQNYASGWNDGFRQCQATAEADMRRDYEERYRRLEDRDYEAGKNRLRRQ